jgi:cytochrome b involved in lipid metabolism
MDTATMNKFLDVKQDEHIAKNEYEETFYDYLKGNAKKVTYTIKESELKGSTATVTVDCKFIDGSKFFEETILEYAKRAKETAANGKQPTEEEAKEELKKIMTEKQKTVKETFTEKTVKILCVKIRGKWYIDMTGYDIDNVFASNLIDFSVEATSRVPSN